MNAIFAITSGIVQGITEFFPISSTGHLVILQHLFGWKEHMFLFDVFLHFGTLISMFIFFYKDILNIFTKDKRTLVLCIVASIPTAVIGFVFQDTVEAFFGRPRLVGSMLMLTGVWLIFASLYSWYLKRTNGHKKLGVLNSLLVGISQGISIMPGISRSGATISTGILLGLEEEVAFKFSFLLAIPAQLGANLLKAYKIGSSLTGKDAGYFILGAMTAALIGVVAVKVLYEFVKERKLHLFGIYCLIAGVIAIIFI